MAAAAKPPRRAPRKPASKAIPRIGLALARARRPQREISVNAFDVRRLDQLHPPGVVPQQSQIAQDSAPELFSALSWAAGDAIYSAFKEGTTFLGYPYLSVLAQRSEYRVPVETIATEMTREWIEFNTTDEDEEKNEKIKQIEDALTQLNVRDRFRKWVELDGWFGRGHLYLEIGGDDVNDDLEELKTSIGNGADNTSKEKVGTKESQRLTAIRAIEPVWTYPTNYESNNPLKADWYRPNTWHVMGKEVHRTRLLTLVSREVPDLLKPTYSFGGLSMSQMLKPYVDNWLRTRQAVADLIHSFSVFVLKTQLNATLEVDGQNVDARVDLFNATRDNRGTFVIDKDSEDFSNVSTSISGLEGLQSQAQEHMCAVVQIPVVKMLGIQPQGFNASSEGEIRTFYDGIKAKQEALFRRPLTTVIDLVQLSIFGEVDPEITFGFKDLWQLDEAGTVAVEKTKTDIDDANIAMGAIDAKEVRQRLMRDRKSIYSGIDLSGEPPETPGLEPPEGEGEGEDPHGGVPNTGATKPNGRVAQFKPRDPSSGLANRVVNRAANFGGAATGGFKGDAGAAKLLKDEVGYEDPATGPDHCAVCEHYLAPDRCQLVIGPISEDGWCKLFQALPVAAE